MPSTFTRSSLGYARKRVKMKKKAQRADRGIIQLHARTKKKTKKSRKKSNETSNLDRKSIFKNRKMKASPTKLYQ